MVILPASETPERHRFNRVQRVIDTGLSGRTVEMERNNKYRVTLVVEYLGWDDYHFGHSTVRPFLPGRCELGRIGWIAVQGA